jgi:membrane-bound lytic murein transglycosylase D
MSLPNHGNRPSPWFGLGAVALAAILTAPSYCEPVAFAIGAPLADRFLREPAMPDPPPAVTADKTGEPVQTRPVAEGARSIMSAEEAVRLAEAHFEKGRGFYHSGEMDAARREFDLAVEKLMDGLDCPEERATVERRLEKMVEAIHHYDVVGLGAGEDPDQPGFDRSPLDEILEMTFAIDPKLKDKVKDELSATVSQLPLELNDAVVGYVNYFSSERGRRIMAFGLRRAARYRPMISRVLAAEGVPLELMQLAQAESGFMPRAVSRAQAAGMWQFMASRGSEYGLLRSAYHDDRLDPEQATRAAARHLRDLYNEFGDWYLAMAAYNCGPMTVSRAIERTGYADFWELRKRNVLPKETANYVPAILSMIIVAKNAKDYGLDHLEEDPPLVYDTVDIAVPTNLALVADAAGSPLPEIRELNPALLKALAPAGYAMRVPKDSGARVVAGLNAVPAANRLSWRLHKVSEGDTVAAIARRYSVTPAALAAANSADLLAGPEAGTVLAIPAVYREARTAARKKSTSGHHVTPRAGSKAARTMLARSGAHKTVSASTRSATGKNAMHRVKRSAPAATSQVAVARRTRRATAN